MGVYDLPAVFDYVLEVTGQPDLYYAGHSMGTTMFFICMAERPEYNSRIRLMSALAPVSYVGHMTSPLALLAPIANQLEVGYTPSSCCCNSFISSMFYFAK